jgi:hypothetical protein
MFDDVEIPYPATLTEEAGAKLSPFMRTDYDRDSWRKQREAELCSWVSFTENKDLC